MRVYTLRERDARAALGPNAQDNDTLAFVV
jgi:hypothetical protein